MQRFFRDESGNVIILTALTMISMAGFLSFTMDSSRGYYAHQRIAQSADIASLAGVMALGEDATDEEIQAVASKYFNANATQIASFSPTLPEGTIIVDRDNNTVEVTPEATINRTFTTISDQADFDARFTSRAQIGATSEEVTVLNTLPTEVALVTDVSHSMNQQSRLRRMQQSARLLINTLYDSAEDEDEIHVSIVPFEAKVRMEPELAFPLLAPNRANLIREIEAYMDSRGGPPNREWNGCLIAQEDGEDLTDTPPSQAPLEPYISDEMAYYYSVGAPSMISWRHEDIFGKNLLHKALFQFQGNYQEQFKMFISERGNSSGGTGNGSANLNINYNCDPFNKIEFLDNNRDANLEKIDNLNISLGWEALRGTVGSAGMVWGWRTLSPRWAGVWDGDSAFPQPYATTKKAIVFLTDGINEIPDLYGYYGISPASAGGMQIWRQDPIYRQLAWERYGITATQYEPMDLEIDRRFLQICANVKAAGIDIYTIGYDIVEGERSRAMTILQECATSPDMAYFGETENELDGIFEDIGTSISEKTTTAGTATQMRLVR